MNDLFKKLNTLVKATVNDTVGDPFRPRTPDPLSKKMDQDIEALRQRINEAIAHEDKIRASITTLQQEIAQLDQQADAAVQAGNDALARQFIERIQRAQQRLAMAEADLREHQLVAQELIQRVNVLDATVADARRERDLQRESATEPEQSSDRVNTSLDAVSNVIQQARDKITAMTSRAEAEETNPAADETPAQPDNFVIADVEAEVKQAKVEDDLEARRNRLSKR
ncbi:MAG: hypothetical protein OHK0046_02860 [Anaerolineae bacterium]